MICENCRQEIAFVRTKLAETVARQICWQHGVSLPEIQGPSKTKRIVDCRGEIWWELVIAHRWSLPMAANHIGRRHHTSVLHLLRKMAHARYGLPMNSTLEEIRRAWVLDPSARPLVDYSNDDSATEKAA